MATLVEPTPYVQPVDIVVRHAYADDDTFEEIAGRPTEELDEDTHFHREILIRRNARVDPDASDIGFTVATVTFERDAFFVQIPRAPHSDWLWTAHGNIINALEEDDIEPAEAGAKAHYNHGLPHPLLNASFIDDILPPSSSIVTNHEADWYEPSHTVVKYSFDDGDVYLDQHSDNVFFDGEDDLKQQFNYYIAAALESAVEEALVDVRNPYDSLFDRMVLYPAFARKPSLISFWNAIAPSLFDVDFATDTTTELRQRTHDLGMRPLQAFVGWLFIGASIESEIRAFGETKSVVEETLEIDDPSLNWSNAITGLEQLGPSIQNAATERYYDYSRDALPDHDTLLRIHAGDTHMQLAVKPLAYRPVFYMGSSDKWDDANPVDAYFWSEGGWYLEIQAARPCDTEDGEFDPTEVYEYMDERNGDRTIVALASNIEDAEPISEDEVADTMVSVVGAPSPADRERAATRREE